MKQEEVERISIWEGETQTVVEEIITTPISWVLLTERHAFKIKRPVRTSYLNNSTISKRKHHCEKELVLNKRLAKEIYIKVVPISAYENNFIMDEQKGEIVDYAVKMHRMNYHRQMDVLLKEGKVTTFDIEKIADKITEFHRETKIISLTIDKEQLKKDFNDIRKALPFIRQNFGMSYAESIEEICFQSDEFIEKNAALMQERVSNGYYRDCHGDLHAKNIILENEPIIFDCIEFNDSFRHIDVLNEIAFFCMELEVMDKNVLNNYFMKKYLMNVDWQLDPVLENLLCYYKMYKANVRAKVVTWTISIQNGEDIDRETEISALKKYLDQMALYSQELNTMLIP